MDYLSTDQLGFLSLPEHLIYHVTNCVKLVCLIQIVKGLNKKVDEVSRSKWIILHYLLHDRRNCVKYQLLVLEYGCVGSPTSAPIIPVFRLTVGGGQAPPTNPQSGLFRAQGFWVPYSGWSQQTPSQQAPMENNQQAVSLLRRLIFVERTTGNICLLVDQQGLPQAPGRPIDPGPPPMMGPPQEVVPPQTGPPIVVPLTICPPIGPLMGPPTKGPGLVTTLVAMAGGPQEICWGGAQEICWGGAQEICWGGAQVICWGGGVTNVSVTSVTVAGGLAGAIGWMY